MNWVRLRSRMIETEKTPAKPREETILRIPNSTVHLMEGWETLKLAQGDFSLVKIVQDSLVLAIFVKVGEDLRWPLTRDEPIVKVDQLHYLFSLPGQGGKLFSYGVTFSEQNAGLPSLDSLLKENSSFSMSSSDSALAAPSDSSGLYWKEFAPRVEDYNGLLAKAIAAGTGAVIKGIFECSSAYSNQVQSGGEMIRTHLRSVIGKASGSEVADTAQTNVKEENDKLKMGLRRARNISNMTEKMSRTLLEGIALASGSMVIPLVQSQAGKRFLSSTSGEVLLATLDAVNKVFDALEAAEKEAFSATSTAVTGVVSQRYGEATGEMTNNALATAGHAAGTVWNVFKMRRAFNPTSMIRNGAKTGRPPNVS
ncbi:senescence/dehydration-associated protein At4g35985, chloroplastic-like [Aristolochia californica]|uniref:senescence/dehydration-associated protein At4g35985, chloroplastic-like n=1 Tax=Aristolochia californica TaxID=171875 RepID=UPI0035D9CEC7